MLIDQSWEEFERQNPLAKFSFYLWGRVSVLFDIRIEILQCLDNAFANDLIAHESLSRAEMLSWLWILGAYEVVRTMCQADTCFSPEAAAKLSTLKRKLAIVRMPAAKMEKIGKSIPVTSGRSAAGIDLRAYLKSRDWYNRVGKQPFDQTGGRHCQTNAKYTRAT
ncbi:MAG: hypothetical protein R3C14_25745 [Caldilineaceae bacterium]